MDRERAREIIRGELEGYLQQKGINTRKPFPCLNPEHPDRNPSMSFDRRRNKCHCFSCGADYDTLDIIGIDYGLQGNELFLKAYEIFRLDVENGQPQRKSQQQPVSQPAAATVNNMAYYRECHGRIDQTDYPARRGLSSDTVNRFMIGFDPHYNKGTGGKEWEALIIPTGRGTYVARNTDPTAEKKDRYRKQGGNNPFNLKAMGEAEKPVFIVEGELDALSIEETGGKAVALGSTANVDRLLKFLEQNRPQQPLIISLDNDKDGQAAAEKLAEGLERLSIPMYRQNIAEGYKDANEALLEDREAFTAAIRAAECIEAAELEEERESHMKEAAAYQLQSFVDDIEQSEKAAFLPTGFPALDKALDGGLYAGLYIIGAISSLGKTSFCLQVADQVAAAGYDVLIFSLEMSRNELIAKSVSRNSLLVDLEKNQTTRNAKTTRGILTGSRYKFYSAEERAVISSAIGRYGEYAGNIYISEGVGNIGVAQVREKVEKHIKITGKAPLVLIDYLQIMAPADPRATDKQNTDRAVLELKRMSRDNSLPVLAISSFNRDNYTAPVNLASFKESGAVEYSSDVLLGLQYEGMDYQEGENDKAREKRVRELVKQNIADGKAGKPQHLQLKILKSRNGSKGESLLEFYPMFNYFTEPEQQKSQGAKVMPMR